MSQAVQRGGNLQQLPAPANRGAAAAAAAIALDDSWDVIPYREVAAATPFFAGKVVTHYIPYPLPVLPSASPPFAEPITKLIKGGVDEEKIGAEIERLVALGAKVNECDEKEEMTALHLAATLGKKTVVRALFKCGANPNVVDRSGATALHVAVPTRDPELFELLISFKVPLSQRTRAIPHFSGLTPFMTLHKIDRALLAPFLKEGRREHLLVKSRTQGTPFSTLLFALPMQQLIELLQIPEIRATLNDRDQAGYTAVQRCVRAGMFTEAKVLIQSGYADWQLKLPDGRTLSQLAEAVGVSNKEREVFIAFLEKLEPKEFPPAKVSSSFVAAVKKLVEDEKLNDNDVISKIASLIEQGADVNEVESDGKAALHLAVASGRISVVIALVKTFGADPQIEDAQRNNALHISVEECPHKELFETLIELGVSLEMRNFKGHTPFMTLILNDHLKKELSEPFLQKDKGHLKIRTFEGQSLKDLKK